MASARTVDWPSTDRVQRRERLTFLLFLAFRLDFFATFLFFRVTFGLRFRLAGVGLNSSSAANSSTPSCEPVAATLTASTTSLTASPITPQLTRHHGQQRTFLFRRYRISKGDR
jgi:hypothetical protein